MSAEGASPLLSSLSSAERADEEDSLLDLRSTDENGLKLRNGESEPPPTVLFECREPLLENRDRSRAIRPPLGDDSLGLDVAESLATTSITRGARVEEDRHRRWNDSWGLLRPLLPTLLPAGLLATPLRRNELLALPSALMSCSEVSVDARTAGLPIGEGVRLRAVTA